jgi:hypothetical protein
VGRADTVGERHDTQEMAALDPQSRLKIILLVIALVAIGVASGAAISIALA